VIDSALVANCWKVERRRPLDQLAHSRIVSFIWGIANDVLRDLFKRE